MDELEAAGFRLSPGVMGENVTTRGVDLLGLPTGTRLRLGAEAVIEVTGLRNPCRQLNDFQPGLMNATLDRDADGNLIRKAGIMGIVLAGGEIKPGDAIEVELPPEPRRALEAVSLSRSPARLRVDPHAAGAVLVEVHFLPHRPRRVAMQP